jgi:hypothetical protein
MHIWDGGMHAAFYKKSRFVSETKQDTEQL